jgi:hypothetical protein
MFVAKVVLNKGIDALISEIEDALDSIPKFPRGKIRQHVLEGDYIEARGETLDKAKEKLADIATSKQYLLADIALASPIPNMPEMPAPKIQPTLWQKIMRKKQEEEKPKEQKNEVKEWMILARTYSLDLLDSRQNTFEKDMYDLLFRNKEAGTDIKFENDFENRVMAYVKQCLKKGECISSDLIQKKMQKIKNTRISGVVCEYDNVTDFQQRFNLAATRMFYRLLENIQVKGGEVPTVEQVEEASRESKRQAYILVPEAFKSQSELEEMIKEAKIHYDFSIYYYKSVFSPEKAIREKLENVSLAGFDDIIKYEAEKVRRAKETVWATAGDTSQVLQVFEEALGKIREAKITQLMHKHYSGKDEEKAAIAERIYYEQLNALAQSLAGKAAAQKPVLEKELQDLEKRREELDGQIGEQMIGTEQSGEYAMNVQNTAEQIKAKKEQLVRLQLPSENDYSNALENAKKASFQLLGCESDLLNSKTAEMIMHDYFRQTKTLEILWQAYIGKYYQKIMVENDVVYAEESAPDAQHATAIQGMIQNFKKAVGPVNEQAFGQLVNLVRTELAKSVLKCKNFSKFDYYSELIKLLLHPAQLAKKLEEQIPVKRIETEYPVKTQLSLNYCIRKICWDYLGTEMKTSQAIAKARQSLEIIRAEEIARTVFYQTFAEFADKQSEPPSQEQLQRVLQIAFEKIGVLLPDYSSVVHKKFADIGELESEYWNIFRNFDYYAAAQIKSAELLDQYMLPKLWVQLWEDIGERKPTAEELFGVYQTAAHLVNEIDRVAMQAKNDRYKEHLKKYAETIEAQKSLLEHEYEIHN